MDIIPPKLSWKVPSFPNRLEADAASPDTWTNLSILGLRSEFIKIDRWSMSITWGNERRNILSKLVDGALSISRKAMNISSESEIVRCVGHVYKHV